MPAHRYPLILSDHPGLLTPACLEVHLPNLEGGLPLLHATHTSHSSAGWEGGPTLSPLETPLALCSFHFPLFLAGPLTGVQNCSTRRSLLTLGVQAAGPCLTHTHTVHSPPYFPPPASTYQRSSALSLSQAAVVRMELIIA